MVKFISKYFSKTLNYSPWRFILEITTLIFPLKLLSIVLFDIVLAFFNIHFSQNLSFEKSQVNEGVISVILTVPFFALLETLISQWFVIWLTSKFTKKLWIQILTATIIFTLLHVDPSTMIAILPVGAILSWVFVMKRQKTLKSAVFITASIHTLHNYIALLLVFLTIH